MIRLATVLFGLVLSVSYNSIAQDEIAYHDPVWSPDGKQITFYSNLKGNFDIYVVNRNGKGLKQITDHPGNDSSPTWSHDGKKILFKSTMDNTPDLYTYELATGHISRLTDNENVEGASAWSNDGKHIAFELKKDNQRDIFIMNADGSNVRNLTNSASNDFWPTWSAESRIIYFQSNRTGKYQLFQTGIYGGEASQLYPEEIHQTSPAIMHTQNKIIFTTHYENGVKISLLDLDSRQVNYLTDDSTDKMMASFSPDDKEVVFVQIADRYIINILDMKSKKIRPLID